MQRRAILGGTFNPPHIGHLTIASTAMEQAGLQQVIWVPAGRPPHRTINSLPECHHRLEMIRRAIAPYSAFSLSTVECDRPSPSYAIDTLIELQRQYPTSQWYWIIGLDAFQALPRWYRRLELIPRCTWLVAPRAIEIVPSNMPPANITPTKQPTQDSQAESIEPSNSNLNALETVDLAAISKHAAIRPPVSENSSFFWTSEDYNLQAETHLTPPTLVALCDHVAQQLASQQIAIQWQLLEMPLVAVSSSLIRQHYGDRHPIHPLVPPGVQDYIQQHQLYAQSLDQKRPEIT